MKKRILVTGLAVLVFACGLAGCLKKDPATSSAQSSEVTAAVSESEDKTAEKTKDKETKPATKPEVKTTSEKETENTKKTSEGQKQTEETKPTQPATPTQSDEKPSQPTQPSQPSTKPTQPVEPQPQPTPKPEEPTQPSQPSHTHKWEPVYTTVHHEAEYTQVDHGHYVEVVDSEAWDEPVYHDRTFCNGCGMDITDIGLEHTLDCMAGYHNEWVQTGSIHHDAVTHQEWEPFFEAELVKDAWDEQVISGYKCSCGAQK